MATESNSATDQAQAVRLRVSVRFDWRCRSGDRAYSRGGAGPHRPAEPDLSLFARRRDRQNRMGAMPRWVSGRAAEHVPQVVIDRMEVLRGRIHRTHFDHEAVRDDPIAERLL